MTLPNKPKQLLKYNTPPNPDERYKRSLQIGLLLPALFAIQSSFTNPQLGPKNHNLDNLTQQSQTLKAPKHDPNSIQSLLKRRQEKELKDKKEIIKNTFILEGWKEGSSTTSSSKHGQEDFLTSACGITEHTYTAAQKKWGIKNPKPLSHMTPQEVVMIIDSEFMQPLEKYGQLPKSIMMMRFQAIWNLGEGKENKVWNGTLAQLKIKLGEGIAPSQELEIINLYSLYQKSTNKRVHEPQYQKGLLNRVNNSLKLAKSMIKPKQ
jgi:hypothetical protein